MYNTHCAYPLISLLYQTIYQSLQTFNMQPIMTPAAYHVAPMHPSIFVSEEEALWHQVKSMPTLPVFLDLLWYRVSNALFFLYEESGKVITPDIEEAACALLLDTLRVARLDSDADINECCYELTMEALPSRAQRLRQLVHTMLLLAPIVSLKQGTKRPSIFVDIVDCLQPGEQLSWAVVSRAFEDRVPDPRYDPILECLAGALLDYSDEHVPFILGPQWRVSGPPCTRTLLKMQCLKIKLLDEPDESLIAISELRVDRGTLMALWRRIKPKNSWELKSDVSDYEQCSSDDEDGCCVERVAFGHVQHTDVESMICDEYAEESDENELDDEWSSYMMGLVRSSGICRGLCQLMNGPCSC
jgi:hypothetical protein